MKNFTNSDIFNSYIELAEKRGLVRFAEEDVQSSKRALEKNPRADSLTQEKIEKLYNLELDSPKEMRYQRNIIEVAHPKPAYVHNAYDKINGLVENANERQDILLRIVNKRTNGAIAQHKYAEDEMVRALVRIANDMDNRDEEELRSLADECLNSFKKKAFNFEDLFSGHDIPSAIRPFIAAIRSDVPAAAIAGLAAVIIGAPVLPALQAGAWAGLLVTPLVAYFTGTAPKVKLMDYNCEKLEDAIGDVLESLQGEPKEYLEGLLQESVKLRQLSVDYYSHDQNDQKDLKLISNLKLQSDKMEEVLAKYSKELHDNIQAQYSKKEEIGDIEEKFRDFFSPMWSGLVPVNHLKDCINSLKESIINFKNKEKDLLADIQSTFGRAVQSGKQMLGFNNLNYQSPIRGDWKNLGDMQNYSQITHPGGHDGLDMGAPKGTPVYPLAEGVVSGTSINSRIGGNTVNIEHSNGLTSYYAHLDTVDVQDGDEVDHDTQIGTVGNTGNASRGPYHLHFAVRKTKDKSSWMDPTQFLLAPGVEDGGQQRGEDDEAQYSQFAKLIEQGGKKPAPTNNNSIEELQTAAIRKMVNLIKNS